AVVVLPAIVLTLAVILSFSTVPVPSFTGIWLIRPVSDTGIRQVLKAFCCISAALSSRWYHLNCLITVLLTAVVAPFSKAAPIFNLWVWPLAMVKAAGKLFK